MTPLFSLKQLRIQFGSRDQVVEDVSFKIYQGQVLALVGESGSGKTLTGLALTGLLPKNALVTQGSLELNDTTYDLKNRDSLIPLRGGEIAYVFQEPGIALNPVLKIGNQVLEALLLRYDRSLQKRNMSQLKKEIFELFLEVGLTDFEKIYEQYPFELSGGMLQRVVIAIALACQPKLLVADEATTALDVTIQAQIIQLLKDLKLKRNMSILFITHNLALLPHFANDVVVLKRGRVIEYGLAEDILLRPQEEYTKKLIACLPIPGRGRVRLNSIESGL